MRGYDQQYRKILESAPKADEVRRLCEQVSGWYGEWGSRIDGLIASKDAAPNSPGVLVGKRTPPKK